MTKGDTHRVERNTSEAAHGYTVQRLEARVRELEAKVKMLEGRNVELLADAKNEKKMRLDYAAELRRLTNHKIGGDIDD